MREAGDITAQTFDAKRFLDREVVDLMSKVELRENIEFTREYPEVWNCKVIAPTKSGEQHQVHIRYPKGHPKSPFTDKEVDQKFMRLAEPSLGAAGCRSFLDWAWRLEESNDVGTIFDLVAPKH